MSNPFEADKNRLSRGNETSEKPLEKIGFKSSLSPTEPNVLLRPPEVHYGAPRLLLDRLYYQEMWEDHEIPGEREHHTPQGYTIYIRGTLTIPWRLQSVSVGNIFSYYFRARTSDRTVARVSPITWIPYLYSKHFVVTNHRENSIVTIFLEVRGHGDQDTLPLVLRTGSNS